MHFGQIELPHTAALAPMAGVADRAFREICVDMGACYVVGEMASAKGLLHRNGKTADLLALSQAERPAAIQLFGDDATSMAEAARLAQPFEPDVLDINMGCPAPKIAGGGSGAALMKSPETAAEIIRAVCESSPIPVTVKMRKGWDDDSVNAPNAVTIARLAEQNGAAAVCVHGRTRKQMYAPPVDLEIIAAVKQAVNIPVIGNGDVADIASAVKMYEETGCDLVMVGRGALGAPWVFRQLREYFLRGIVLPEPELDEKMAVMLRHIRLACEYKTERVAMREARSHAAWYLKGMRGAAALRRRAGQLERFEQLEQLARDVLDAQANI